MSLEPATETASGRYPDQQLVYEKAKTWLRDPRPSRPYFFFKGPAGGGKTKVLADLCREYPDSTMCAFAGKSASVLRARTGLDVTTVHSAIFDFKGVHENEDGERQPIFQDKGVDFTGRLVFLDECGTIGTWLGEKLLDTGARVISCGDPYQLKPVRDHRFFDEADAEITEIRRQAWDSAIIRQAHAMKDHGEYRPDGDDFQVIVKSQVRPNHLRFGGIALCWRNLTRQRLNVSRRKALGHGGDTLEAGEPVMLLRNDHAKKVYNGEIYKVVCKRPPGEDLLVEAQDGRQIYLQNVTCEGIDAGFDERRDRDDWVPVALAYATTVHKFIGSEENDVLLLDEYNTERERREWVYTGITRAARRILVVQA